ncbi:MAG: lactonase family protein [Nannocystaceae bacterium]|nr:lactonase family protein [bacterium]
MTKRACGFALAFVLGCSDDGLPADDTDVSATGNVGVTSDDGFSTQSGSGDTNDSVSTDPSGSGTSGPEGTTTGFDPTGDSTGSTGGVPVQGEPRLYVTGGNAVSVWEIDDAGALTQVQTLDQGTGLGPLAQWNSQFMYAARVDEQAVAALAIDPVSGALTELGVTGVAHRPVYMSVDPTGGWLLSADFGQDLVQVNPINADGTVDGTPSQSSTVQSRPHAILFDPSGQYVFVPHRDANLVEQYVFDDIGGTLTPNDPPSVSLPKGAGARHMAFAPDATRAYVVNEFDSSVTAFSYDATTGLLTEGVTVSALPPGFEGENTGADIHVSSDGAYVYASMRGDDSIAVFAAGADGGLTYQANVPTEPRPREFGLGPFGNFLYAAGQDSGMLAGYTIEADGNLTPGAVYPVGDGPLWVLGVELPAR